MPAPSDTTSVSAHASVCAAQQNSEDERAAAPCSSASCTYRKASSALPAASCAAERGARKPAARPNSVLTMRLSGEEAIESEALLVGSPATIKRYVERYTEETGANYFCASFQWGDLTHAEASKSLRLFSEHVMPAFATA